MEMAKIAGYMHDIGNTVNRYDHAHSSAVLAYGILKEREMKLEDILTITSAIGQHDEETGTAVDAVSAALTWQIKQMCAEIGYRIRYRQILISMTG